MRHFMDEIQLGYPLMLIGAGLPKIYTMLSEAKSYSERLFIYKEIDSLDRDRVDRGNPETGKIKCFLYGRGGWRNH